MTRAFNEGARHCAYKPKLTPRYCLATAANVRWMRLKFPFSQISRFRLKFPFSQISRFRLKFSFATFSRFRLKFPFATFSRFRFKFPFAYFSRFGLKREICLKGNLTRASIKSLRQQNQTIICPTNFEKLFIISPPHLNPSAQPS